MSWKIYVLRTFLILYVIVDTVMATVAIVGARVGNSELVIQMLDHEGDVPPDIIAPLWGVGLMTVLSIGYIWCLISLFVRLDRLVISAQRGALANMDTAQTLRGLGKSLIALWVSLMAIEAFAPLAMFWAVVENGDIDVMFAPFDLKVVLALTGMALSLVAGLAEEADDMKKELSGVV